ncbi:hypothetical protein GLOIN_2v1537244 [Rhizophagus irregularis DAOM 181602=DAOM 197198]|uniref:Uncharacterized protein n=1 Tax=Rhizophagus irregularis (strain DAOM 181602 / DAOM 197198 / MUCL 43194) TaxID=747089 RepID=A0A2P4QLG0_RHIID|nr:hypothetical protein GLOIN_2v1537244 [Rhizophagus irregularis DAOM 181602=DAOM 197198]POG78487.1 hypothetical protein GLOIN_2v1537244 [Rhizophagus irregularis DAOM 181602=DAOM 197198]|eukprot:XP_025185353.1 hypothetical protein GLOIN_2v1537244 [Rhizophagus irregularis DAOM 181602=DAOM 197198]
MSDQSPNCVKSGIFLIDIPRKDLSLLHKLYNYIVQKNLENLIIIKLCLFFL